MKQAYEAYRVAADGMAGEQVPGGDDDGAVIATGTIEECREAIEHRLGADNMLGLQWAGGEGDVEAYYDSEDEGCGGYHIRPAEGSLQVGDRVEGGQRDSEDWDAGRVVALRGTEALIAWQSETRTWTPISLLRHHV